MHYDLCGVGRVQAFPPYYGTMQQSAVTKISVDVLGRTVGNYEN